MLFLSAILSNQSCYVTVSIQNNVVTDLKKEAAYLQIVVSCLIVSDSYAIFPTQSMKEATITAD
ncbi:hypothetical protein ANAPH2_01567 [Anaplasma phagocytophilum]|nr:hypothetical protein ANAPH2_01567 [Anaplasma phagocytophilum]